MGQYRFVPVVLKLLYHDPVAKRIVALQVILVSPQLDYILLATVVAVLRMASVDFADLGHRTPVQRAQASATRCHDKALIR
jgi:hypothetical protein